MAEVISTESVITLTADAVEEIKSLLAKGISKKTVGIETIRIRITMISIIFLFNRNPR